MKNNLIIVVLLVAIVAGVGGFFGGMKYEKYQQSKQSAFTRQFGNRAQGNGQMQGRGNTGFRPVNGQIIKADNNSITVKLQDGSSKIVILTDSTTINQAAQASKSDLKEGETVAVFGQQNSDGSVTAQTIQLNPQFREQPAATPTTQ